MFNKNLTCLQKGIYLLSRREYSQIELHKKLLTYGYSLEEVKTTIEKLKEKNWQNDERFAHYIARKNINKGKIKLMQSLKEHALSEDNIKTAKDILEQNGTEYERALSAWERKFDNKALINKDNKILDKQEIFKQAQKYQQKQIRFLVTQGFSFEIAIKVIKNTNKKYLEEE